MEDVANSLVRGVTDICVSKFQILSALIFSGYNCLKEKKKGKKLLLSMPSPLPCDSL